MSELITTHARADIRLQLLATVSALSLMAVAASQAKAEDAGRPTVWIELGGQLQRVQNEQEAFAPPFTIANLNKPYNLVSPLAVQRPPRYAFGGEGKISIEPAGTDWVFSASLLYGRSNSGKLLHQQTATPKRVHGVFPDLYTVFIPHFDDTNTAHRESHAIADFTAGKDVGLGLFGRSVFSLGVRYAQFHTQATTTLLSQPDLYYPTNMKYGTKFHHHSFYGHSNVSRNFAGVGPTLSLSGSSPVAGSVDTAEIAFDWGANVALLFGRQNARGNYKATGRYFHGTGTVAATHYTHSAGVDRSRRVVVPNVGGFAGLVFRHANAKVSMGYRADFFFNAMDSGIDARHPTNVSFYGPFATISIGLP